MKNNEPITIAIVGGGAAGTATAHYLVQLLEKQKRKSGAVEIDIYEKRGVIELEISLGKEMSTRTHE
jgi:cation diffusion facilitator CzcD-associated flavoprotein CzcO